MRMKIFYLFLLVSYSIFIFPLKAKERAEIKAIVFDFGGVIAKTDKEEVSDFIANSLNISQPEAMHSLRQLKEHTDQGLPEANFWKVYAQSINKKLPMNWLEQLNIARFQALKEIPGMVDVVKELQKQGFLTPLLSNVRKSQAEVKRRLGYYELFSPLLLSCETGVKKPDPQAYCLLLDQLQLLPEEVLFIDNKLTNVEMAQTLGMEAIQFIHTQQIIEELKQRGIRVSL